MDAGGWGWVILLKEVKVHVVSAVTQKQSKAGESWWETARGGGGEARWVRRKRREGEVRQLLCGVWVAAETTRRKKVAEPIENEKRELRFWTEGALLPAGHSPAETADVQKLSPFRWAEYLATRAVRFKPEAACLGIWNPCFNQTYYLIGACSYYIEISICTFSTAVTLLHCISSALVLCEAIHNTQTS